MLKIAAYLPDDAYERVVDAENHRRYDKRPRPASQPV
jgi:hypothetical protein